ncbi:MAG: aryl-alcohol dehydrogenase-like predicted oxidoreductase [Candidatus Azotimanducaceae bacterium]|jgi:aryl-alcohol dehydrogenase-like predicted oxidoreductase
MKLTRRPLGSLDIDTAPLALGTVKFGRNRGIKYPTPFELPGDDDIVRLLNLARESGINLIDTAPAYGVSESRLGKLLPGLREEWVICSKAGEQYNGGDSHYDYSTAALNQSVDESLRHLGTDYLDIVLIHSDGRDIDILTKTDAMETLRQRQAKGDIRYIGLSGKTVAGAQLAMNECDVLMVTFNSSDASHRELIHTAADQGVGILVKKALDSGHAQANESLSYVLSDPGVHCAVVGTINPDHLKSNIRIAAKATQFT